VLYPSSSINAKQAVASIIDKKQQVLLQPITLEDVYFSLLGKKEKGDTIC